MQNRIADNFLDDYSRYFVSLLKQLDEEIEVLRRQVLAQIYEQNQSNKIAETEAKLDGPRIKVIQPLASELSTKYQKSRPSVKMMDDMGVRKFEVSCMHFTKLTKLNTVESATSRVDQGTPGFMKTL